MSIMLEAAAVSTSEAVAPTTEGCCSDSLYSVKSLELALETSSCGLGAAQGTEPSELDKAEYKTDEFRLYNFKIAPCTNEEAHDWCLCPFAHPAEKAMRRDPRLHKYTGISCPDYRKGTCKRGNACPYAHGVFEVWLHPSRYRTQLCKDGLLCTRQVCFFAHTPEELRQVEPEEAPVLDDANDLSTGSSTGTSILARSESNSTVSTTPSEPSLMPKCGPNTNAKAAAAAKAKATSASTASEKSTLSSASSNASDKTEKMSGSTKSGSMSLSRSSTSSSPVNTGFAAGLHTLGSFSSQLSNSSMLSLLSPGSLPGTTVGNLGQQHWNNFNSMLSHSAANMAPLQMDAVTAEQAVAACGSAGLGGLSDTFGSLDLVAAAAANGLGAVGAWPSSTAASGSAGVGSTSLTAALAAISLGLPAPQLNLGSDMGLAGQISAANLALATAAQQAAEQQHQQHQQQQQMQEMMTVVLLHQQLQQQQQQRQQQQQQQHRQAMWTAAFNAASNVGLDDISAAACANAAVQSTTAGADNHVNAMAAATAPMGTASVADNSHLMQVPNHQLQLAAVQDANQLLVPAAALLQQQQQAGMHNMVREGYMGGVKGYAGQAPLQIPVAATAGNAGGYLM